MTLGYDDQFRKHCVLAAATTCTTVVFGLAFRPMMTFGVLPLFLAPVLMCAVLGSRRAGLIATAASIPLAAFVFIPPDWSFEVTDEGLLRLAVFAADAILISVLFGERTPCPSPA